MVINRDDLQQIRKIFRTQHSVEIVQRGEAARNHYSDGSGDVAVSNVISVVRFVIAAFNFEV